ncbi:MAG: FAD/NAD(P)-binding oxidoreductase [Thermodesulfobacteriota bacterium]
MRKRHFVVIGNGPAGHQAALTLREHAPSASVTVISREQGVPYKPHFLPKWVAGEVAEENLTLCPFDAYREKGIELRCGQGVRAVDLSERRLVLEHREIVPFTGLIIAVGGRSRIPEPLLPFEDVLFTLKTTADAVIWKEALPRVNSVLILGGDLTSLAMTQALLTLGKKVHFMVDGEALWPLRSTPALLKEIGRKLSRRGVHVLPSGRLRSLARISDDRYEVRIEGKKLQVGMVGAFFGLVPDIRFLAGSGLRIDRGILVDEYLNTGFADVYATGDCAQVYHPAIRDYWVSVGYDNAVALGRTAALNLAGGRNRAEAAKKNILEVQGIKVNTSWWMDF